MARLCVVAVRDSAMGAFQRPFVSPAVASAVRAFYDEVKREGSEMFKHPEDYELWELGAFVEETGELVPASHDMRCLARAVDAKP